MKPGSVRATTTSRRPEAAHSARRAVPSSIMIVQPRHVTGCSNATSCGKFCSPVAAIVDGWQGEGRQLARHPRRLQFRLTPSPTQEVQPARPFKRQMADRPVRCSRRPQPWRIDSRSGRLSGFEAQSSLADGWQGEGQRLARHPRRLQL